MASSIPPPHPDLKSPGNMNSLDELIAESERSLKRLEQLQKKKDLSIGQRFSSHLKRNSGHLINVALAGSVFVVALSRLNEKYSHQVCYLPSTHMRINSMQPFWLVGNRG